MDVAFNKKNKTILIRVVGEIDHHTAQELREKTENALIQMGGRNILFDFSGVTFMDSSGIGMLIGRYKQVQVLGGRMGIFSVNETIEEIIRLSGLNQLFPIFVTLQDAFSYVEGREGNAV